MLPALCSCCVIAQLRHRPFAMFERMAMRSAGISVMHTELDEG